MATHPQSSPVRFGDFAFDPHTGELRRNGVALKLAVQPAKVLSHLIERAGQIVTRQDLVRHVWGAGTFVDFEQGLNFAIRQIRAALEDEREHPRFVETLPKRGYRFIATVAQTIPRAIHSIAVLPLESLSPDPEQEYFADGITDELITVLAKVSSLRVISRTSVQQYKRAREPLPEIARKLNVDAVVEGTILRWEGRVRITAQLLDARTEAHLWAESYERDLGDVMKLQAEITQAIARQINVRLSSEDQSRLKSAGRVNPAAHESYLKGRYFWNKRTDATLKKAQEHFEDAISKDPAYALAYSGLADTYFFRGYIFGRSDPREVMPKAKASALRALELNPALAEAHTSLGLVLFFYEFDLPRAGQEFEAALQLNPNYPTGYHAYSAYLAIMGRHQEAIRAAQRGLAIDPLSIPINNFLGETLMFAQEWERAAEQFRQSIEMDPNVWLLHFNLGLVFEETGKLHEAAEEYLTVCALEGASPHTLGALRAACERDGLAGFRKQKFSPDLESWDGWSSDPFRIAQDQARLGENDSALALLEQAYEAHSGWVVWIQNYPHFHGLRSHPRFQRLARRLGLPQEVAAPRA